MTRELRPKRTEISAQTWDRRSFVKTGAALAWTAASRARVHGADERIGLGCIGYGLMGKRHVIDFKEQPQLRWDSDKEEMLGDPDVSQMLVRPYRKSWNAELRALGVG